MKPTLYLKPQFFNDNKILNQKWTVLKPEYKIRVSKRLLKKIKSLFLNVLKSEYTEVIHYIQTHKSVPKVFF